MIDRLRLGMPTRLLLAFAAVILPLALFAAWSYRQTLDDRRASALEDQLQLAQTAGAVLHGILRDFDTTMLAASLSLAGQQRPLGQETVGPLLASLAERYPFVRTVFLIGPDGRVLATPTGQTLGTDLSGQPYTRAMLAGQDFVLTDVMAGTETGTPIVVMGRTIKANGQLRGMLVFAFYPSRFTDVFPGDLPADTILNVVDRRGTLIYSSAGPDIAREGLDFTRLPIVARALAGEPAPSAGFTSLIDGQERIGAAVPVPEYGWAVTVSRTRASLEQPLSDLFRRQLLVIGLVTAAAMLLAWYLSRALSRPLRQLAEEAMRFGHGELDRPDVIGGPPEVRALAEALDAMAAELDARFRERDAALAETRAALDVRDQFLSVAAHELRTPLTALKGQVQMARRRVERGGEPADMLAFLNRADMQADRLTGLVTDLLDVARISSGRFLVERAPIDPVTLIRHAVDLEQASAPQRRFDVDLPETLPTIRADGPRIEQVLLNLLENARKYSPADAPVRIEASARDGWLEVSILDHGTGIPADDREAIFERFRRAGNVDRNVGGLGLGLYIVREIVQAHGGRISVLSPPDGGSVFTVHLPVALATDETGVEAVPATADT